MCSNESEMVSSKATALLQNQHDHEVIAMVYTGLSNALSSIFSNFLAH